MDPKASRGMMVAPAASRSTTAVRLPGSGAPVPAPDPRPRWTDHVVKEDDQWELVAGQKIELMGAELPHGSAQARVASLMTLFQAPDAGTATELLIRSDVGNDFAPDAALLHIDPVTGEASLPGLVFEVSTTAGNMERAAKKAVPLVAAGVRRVFCLLLEGGPTLFEWDARARKFVSIHEDAVIDDPLLASPMPVKHLLEANGAERALCEIKGAERAIGLAKGEQVGLAQGEQVGLAKGEQVGLAKGLGLAVLGILEDRGLVISDSLRQRIVAERDLNLLAGWRKRAIQVETADEIL